MNIWTIMILVMVLSFIVQQMLQSRFNKYSKIPTANGMSGAEVAQKMLQDHGIYDVKVVPTRGMLTDHFNPQTRTIALSEGVYSSILHNTRDNIFPYCLCAVRAAGDDIFCADPVGDSLGAGIPHCLGFFGESESIFEHHCCGKNGSNRIGDIFAGSLRIGTVDRFEQAAVLAE